MFQRFLNKTLKPGKFVLNKNDETSDELMNKYFVGKKVADSNSNSGK